MAKEIVCRGIPYATTEDELKAAFAEIGEVTSSQSSLDKMTWSLKRFWLY